MIFSQKWKPKKSELIYGLSFLDNFNDLKYLLVRRRCFAKYILGV